MASHFGILERQGRQARPEERVAANSAALSDTARDVVFTEKRRSILDTGSIFLAIASLFNAFVWWGLGTLLLGNSWAVSLSAFVIWLATFFTLAVCSANSE